MKELNIIQTRLVSDKDQRNQFGNYQYRTLDGILNALKPLLAETGCHLNISDEIVLIGNRFYVKATATLQSPDGERISAIGWAREQEDKKGMDQAQVTGTSSTYARKYAVSALLGISDGYDPDCMGEDTELTLEEVLKKIDGIKSRSALDKFYNTYAPTFGNNNDFIGKINWKANQLPA